MSVRPTVFVRDGDVPYQSVSLIIGAGETRLIPGTLRYIQLRGATDATKINISFNGSSFYNLPAGEQLADFEADGVWVQNTDVAPNAVTIVTGMASLNSTRVIIDSSTPLTASLIGTSPVSSVDLGAKADAVATTDTGTFSLIALFKRLLAKFDVLAKSVYSVDALGSTNAALISAGVHRVYSITAVNGTGAAKFVRLYDKATLPTVGTDVAMRVFAIPANSTLQFAYAPGGDSYALGLGIAITGAAAYNDATAVTAHDVQLTINYV